MIKALKIPAILALLPYVLIQTFIFLLIQMNSSQLFDGNSFLMDTITFLVGLGISTFGLWFMLKSNIKPATYQRILLICIVWVFAILLASQVFFDNPWIFQKRSQWLGPSEMETIINPQILQIALILVFFETLLLVSYRFIQIKYLSFLIEILPLIIGLVSLCWLYSQDKPIFIG